MDSVTRIYPAVKGNVGELLEKYHPQRREIYLVVRIMNNIGVNLKLIAASLNLQKWKTFYGDNDWNLEDVKEVIDGYPSTS
jgi:hypothetical protein